MDPVPLAAPIPPQYGGLGCTLHTPGAGKDENWGLTSGLGVSLQESPSGHSSAYWGWFTATSEGEQPADMSTCVLIPTPWPLAK